jgi:hypothetical protein
MVGARGVGDVCDNNFLVTELRAPRQETWGTVAIAPACPEHVKGQGWTTTSLHAAI